MVLGDDLYGVRAVGLEAEATRKDYVRQIRKWLKAGVTASTRSAPLG